MNQRYALLRRANQTKDSKDRDEYKRVRNRVSGEPKSAEASYWKQKLAEVDQGSPNFWRTGKVMRGSRKIKKRIEPIKN